MEVWQPGATVAGAAQSLSLGRPRRPKTRLLIARSLAGRRPMRSPGASQRSGSGPGTKKFGSGAKLGVPSVRQANWANYDEAHVGKGAPAILRRAFGPLITLGLWAFDQQGTRRSSKWLQKNVSKIGPQGNWREMDTKTSTCGILALKF